MFRALLCFLALFAKLAVVTPAIAQPNAAEMEFWENIKTVKNPEVLEAYLEAYLQLYPDGKFVPQARIRLQKLNQQDGGAGGEPAKAEAKQKPKLPEPGGKTADGTPPVHECDRLAAHPFDPDKMTEGVKSVDLNAEAATKACRAALKAYPGTTRFEMQLGRALWKAKSYTNSVIYYRKAAKKGSAQAMYGVAISYWRGKGVEKDKKEAVRWLRRASDKGSPGAMASLGNVYKKGIGGVEKNLQEAVSWWRRASEKGSTYAMNKLGIAFANGEGVSQDLAESSSWYRKAADKGNAFAMSNLGYAYSQGQGVRKDPAEAIRWYRRAIEKGSSVGMNNLGLAYDQGQGVGKDHAEAVKWYRKAADKGNMYAMYNLGLAYVKGRGVREDRTEAIKWYRKAAAKGHEQAKKYLKNNAGK